MPRFLLLIPVVVIALTAGCAVKPRGGSHSSKAEAARKQAEELAASVVREAAETQAEFMPIAAAVPPGPPDQPGLPRVVIAIGSRTSVQEHPQPKSPPRAGPSPIIRERIVSEVPAATEAEAEKQAISAAQDFIERELGKLDPPVSYRPSENEVKKEFLRNDSRTVTYLKDAKGDRAEAVRKVLADQLHLSSEEIGRRVDVEYDVEITADQVRHLRTRDRVGDALRVFAALSVMALAGFLFLRADDWTKGYLTRWLAMGAVLLAGGAAAALYFV